MKITIDNITNDEPTARVDPVDILKDIDQMETSLSLATEYDDVPDRLRELDELQSRLEQVSTEELEASYQQAEEMRDKQIIFNELANRYWPWP